MQRVLPKCGIPVLLIVAAAISVTGIWDERDALAQQPSQLAISPTPPSELNPPAGPAQATLQQAAEFAWEEFFALNWPAGPQPTQRDTPSSCHFGDQSSSCAGPLVWETYRGKVEIFPGTGDPPGYKPQDPSYGYDAGPQYNYLFAPGPCQGTASSPPWVNLDETDQIGLDSMYAGVVSVKPSASNSAPQLIRYVAKANRTEYTYVAKHHWWDGNAPVGSTGLYVINNKQDPPQDTPQQPDNSYVVLPDNTIEIKAGWRLLDPSEDATKFHTATVQYYEKNSDNKTCYQQAVFGLVSLHIIQKTPLAPYFIYATFEQADNILQGNGSPVEDANGTLLSTPQSATTPSVTLNDTGTVSSSGIPPQVVLVPLGAQYCPNPSKQLFYFNTVNKNGLPTAGPICVNKRDNDIPPVIIQTNKEAHALIQSYSSANGITNSVWQYYKLVNVQYQPINKDHASLYGTQPGENDFLGAQNPSTYYLANIVVETNRPLQLFSGSLVQGGTTGANSDYDSQFTPQTNNGQLPHYNVFSQGKAYNMGGCMGCHGAQGQSQGGDFSVIMARGPVLFPEPPAPRTNTEVSAIPRNRTLK